MSISAALHQRQPDNRRLKLHRPTTFGGVSIGPPIATNGTVPPLPTNGTTVAINYLTSGVAPDLPASIARGGARNSATRESHALSEKQVHNLRAATDHALTIGLPFTRMVTIHWMAAGLALRDMTKAVGRFVDLLAKALARHGSTTAWIWVHENGDRKGGHSHLLVHVPAGLVSVITRLQKRWLRRITGKPYRASVILSKPIGGRLGLEVSNPALHAVNLQTSLNYLLKGASDDASQKFKLDRPVPGGRVIGKRCGTSQNIGAKARGGKGESGE